MQSRYYDPQVGRFINADNYAATGQDLLGNNMFGYCGNNPVSRTDPSGKLWRLAVLFVAVALGVSGSSAQGNEVLVLSNSPSDWMNSSATMGNDMAEALGSNYSSVAAVNDDNFSTLWNSTEASHIIVHTHGSPSGFYGESLGFTTSSLGQLQRNTNIQLVLITACEVGGNNGTQANMGQLISQKIAPDGMVICSTTIVEGADRSFYPLYEGEWVVYQNGVQISATLPSVITMQIIIDYWSKGTN